MTEGGLEEREVVPAGLRSGGLLFHGKVAHRDEAERSWVRHTAEDAKNGDKGRGGGGGGGSVLIMLSTNGRRNEMNDRSGGKVVNRFDKPLNSRSFF